ncbi:hypothetical protein ACFSC6_11960 [Rufibacter sediminis]|uniref:Aerotolerance regulator N-terminal domain-containing protein n=1 Tax=Rufibacter sediminis TaxID=2762756 RepID=A0ABR6VTW5_9BACT|nr:hypothetical protein [Rufibacter sediminis]MBC3540596.1 hypothetical protein [Rufibacter sediminis]
MNLSLPFLLVFAGLLGAWFSWLAVRRPDRRRLIWRLLATWGVVACLVLLLAPPHLTRSYNASEAILLTEGYSPDTLRALMKTLRPRPQVYGFETKANGAEAVPDLTSFRQAHPAVKTLHVLGNGLPAEEIVALSGVRLVPHFSPLPAGVLAASWSPEITLGEEVLVQGTFHGTATQPVNLFLQAAGQPRDSVELRKGVDQPFALRFRPKAAGQFVYNLRWKDADDSVQQEDVPVVVQAPRRLSVLLLSSAPSFEGKFLKNALAQQGHSVALRSQMSKDIYATELVNLPALTLNRLTPSLLQKFDVVLLDDVTLQRLSGGEKQALQQAVRQQGLGVLTSVSPQTTKAVPFFTEAVFRTISEKQARNGAVRWAKQTGTSPVLPLSNAVLQPKEGQQALAWEQKPTQALVVHYRKGLGQVGISLVPETFPLALEGKETLYQQYWATILTALAKPEEAVPVTFASTDRPFQEHQPVTFVSSVPLTNASFTSGNAKVQPAIYRQTDAPDNSYATGMIWPQSSGWQTLTLNKKTRVPVYIHASAGWTTQKLQTQRQALLRAASQVHPSSKALGLKREEPVSLWLIGSVLVSLLGFLWLEEKL